MVLAALICLYVRSTPDISDMSASIYTILAVELSYSSILRWAAKWADDDLPRTWNVGEWYTVTILSRVLAPIPLVAPAKTPTASS